MIAQTASIEKNLSLLRYPGGKQRYVCYFSHLLPLEPQSVRTYVEPFLGGGSVFFHVNPEKAILSDINRELVDLYLGIRKNPHIVWELYSRYPANKAGYYKIRSLNRDDLHLLERAARTLYLNRTCFKGMWRHNNNGEFNVGYGGQERRWVIGPDDLCAVAQRLQHAVLLCCDFEETIASCREGDFLYLDPPYRPGEREQLHAHYMFGEFNFEDHKRLASCLREATERGVEWVMTNSSHPDILALYSDYSMFRLDRGTGSSPGQITIDPGEMVIYHTNEVPS